MNIPKIEYVSLLHVFLINMINLRVTKRAHIITEKSFSTHAYTLKSTQNTTYETVDR